MGRMNMSSMVASGLNNPKMTIRDKRLGIIPKKGTLKSATKLNPKPHNAPPSAEV
jgi:hypothetical protein